MSGNAGRRFGYVVAVLINVVLLLAIFVWPGWQVVPFLTDATSSVLGLVSASMIAGIVVNAVYVARDSPRVRAAGDFVTTAIGLAAAIRIWRVFPFDFSGFSFNWAVVVRVLLVIAIVGSVIGLITQIVSFVRAGRST